MTKAKPEYKPPWFTLQVIGIAGPSASGKTSVAKALVKKLNVAFPALPLIYNRNISLMMTQVPWVVLVSTDSFYKPLSREDSARAFENEYDFDAPSAWDWDLMVDKLKALKEGRKVEMPKYSFVKHSRLEETATVYGANIIILEVFRIGGGS
jgi:uridine kinase